MAREEEQTYPTITVKLFASSREIIGKDKITLKLSEKMTALDLRRMILEQFPQFARKIQFVIAVNRKIADDATTLDQMDEVAILPPVSGG
jgi:molybdopterin converting factor subunit 1